jgi:hypothetical protein
MEDFRRRVQPLKALPANRPLLYAYTKAEQGDLTPAQTRQLGRLVREEFK